MYTYIFLAAATACFLFRFNRRFRIVARCAFLCSMWLICQVVTPLVQMLQPPRPPLFGDDDDDESTPACAYLYSGGASDTNESDGDLVDELAQLASSVRRRQGSSQSEAKPSSPSSSKLVNRQSTSPSSTAAVSSENKPDVDSR